MIMTAPCNRQAGMTLVEVMVSVLIFTVGVLGLVALQARATQLVGNSEDRNRAALLGNEAIALLWQYVPTATSVPAIPNNVYQMWQKEVSTPVNGAAGTTSGLLGLPNGAGTITGPVVTAQGTNLYTVTITWSESQQAITNASNPFYTQNQYTTQVTIP
jgi:type IV pilus assembly protein PilV